VSGADADIQGRNFSAAFLDQPYQIRSGKDVPGKDEAFRAVADF
jgi:hypothetical protein